MDKPLPITREQYDKWLSLRLKQKPTRKSVPTFDEMSKVMSMFDISLEEIMKQDSE